MNKPVIKEITPGKWLHTQVIRLKDEPNKRGAFIDLFSVFGFAPRFIAVTKVIGQNNRFIVSAEKTDQILEMEQKKFNQVGVENI